MPVLDEPDSEDALSFTVAYLEASLSRLLTWIRAADSRVALVLPVATAMLGVLAALSPSYGEWSIGAAIASALAALLLVSAIVCTGVASFPRTDGPKGSMIYFGGITTKDSTQYETEVLSMTPDQYVQDLIAQCHRNAEIAGMKYKWVQRGMVCMFSATVPWVLAIFLLYANS